MKNMNGNSSKASRQNQAISHFVGNESGMTIVEVMIASLIASFAIAAGLGTFISTNKNHVIQDGVVHMQQNGRAAIGELSGKIRQAGYKVPLGVRSIFSWNSDPDTIAIVYLREPACSATISSSMPQPSAELKCKDSDLSCFVPDTWAYIWDPFTQTGEYFYITHVQEAAGHLQHNTAKLSKAYPKGSQILMLDFFKYYVDRTTDSLHPMLMKQVNGGDPVVYADDITDLQFRYRTASGAVSDTIAVDRFVYEVELSLLARTPHSDLFLNEFRYDSLSTAVMVRNHRL